MFNTDLSTRQTFGRLWPMISPFRLGLLAAGVALIVNAAIDPFMLTLLKTLLDDVIGRKNPGILVWMPLVIIGLILIRGVSGYISSYCISWVSGKVVMALRCRLFRHLMGMPVAFFDQQSTGTLLSRISYDCEQVASSSSGSLVTVVREGASIKMRRQGMKMVSATSLSDPIIQLLASSALAFVLYAASFPSVMATLTAGSISAVFSAMLMLMRPLKSLTNVNAQFQRGMAACQMLFAILDTEQEKDDGTRVIERVTGDIEFRDVTFTYPGAETPALQHINLTIPAGKTVALVGRSGSGKSTLASLLTRFYNIDSGEILLDGHDLRDYTLASLREQVALVFQHVHLFNDTVANNIAYARTDVFSREAIEKAAQMAHAMEFINKMDNGLDTVIGENGVLLSGGQRQRIAIARALLRDSPILILDEATSALDTESERAIQSALETLQQNRTTLIIAHRLSTIEKADEILLVEDGKIVERGSHQQLLQKNGAYARLYQMQFSQPLCA